MAHCTHEFITKFLKTLSSVDRQANVATWVDCNGLKIRTGKLLDQMPVHLQAGSPFLLGSSPDLIGDDTQVCLSFLCYFSVLLSFRKDVSQTSAIKFS